MIFRFLLNSGPEWRRSSGAVNAQVCCFLCLCMHVFAWAVNCFSVFLFPLWNPCTYKGQLLLLSCLPLSLYTTTLTMLPTTSKPSLWQLQPPHQHQLTVTASWNTISFHFIARGHVKLLVVLWMFQKDLWDLGNVLLNVSCVVCFSGGCQPAALWWQTNICEVSRWGHIMLYIFQLMAKFQVMQYGISVSPMNMWTDVIHFIQHHMSFSHILSSKFKAGSIACITAGSGQCSSHSKWTLTPISLAWSGGTVKILYHLKVLEKKWPQTKDRKSNLTWSPQ